MRPQGKATTAAGVELLAPAVPLPSWPKALLPPCRSRWGAEWPDVDNPVDCRYRFLSGFDTVRIASVE